MRSVEHTSDLERGLGTLNSEWGARYERFAAAPYDIVGVFEFRRFRDPAAGDFAPVYCPDLPGSIQTEEDLLA